MNFFRLKRSIISLIKSPYKLLNFKSYYGAYINLFNKSAPFSSFHISKKYNILNETLDIIQNINDLKKIKITKIQDLYYLKKDKNLILLHSLFDKYRTDKNNHEYDFIYIYLSKKFKYKFKKILEIGIGSNDLKIEGNMGHQAIPGASLFAFKDFYKNSLIYGADIDSSIKLKHKNIKTFFVDQRSKDSLLFLSQKINNLDLIIDDGLHLPNANLLTFQILSKKLKKKGIYIIEDIDEEFLKIFITFARLILSSFQVEIFKTKKRYLFTAIKL